MMSLLAYDPHSLTPCYGAEPTVCKHCLEGHQTRDAYEDGTGASKRISRHPEKSHVFSITQAGAVQRHKATWHKTKTYAATLMCDDAEQ